MGKGIAGALMALAAVVCAAPFGFGLLAQERLQALLDEVNTHGALSAELIRFERGWLRSSADVAVEIAGELAERYEAFQRSGGKDPRPLRCIVRNAIRHGPLPSGAGGPAVAVLESELTGADACRVLQQQLAPAATTWFDLRGGGVVRVSLPRKDIAADTGAEVEWEGLDLQVRFDRGFRSLVTAVETPGLAVRGPDADVDVGTLALESDTRKGVAGLGLGEFSLSLASLAVQPKAPGGVATRIDAITVEGLSRETGAETLEVEVALRAGRVAVDGLDLGAAAYVLALRNIDAEGLVKLNATLAQLRQRHLPPEQMNMVLGATLLGLLPDLLRHGPVFELSELSMGGDGARFVARGELRVDTADPAVLHNPFMLKDALRLRVEVDVPEALLVALTGYALREQSTPGGVGFSEEQVSAMAQLAVRQRMAEERMRRLFRLQDGVYRMRVQMADGRFSINGVVIEPAALMAQP